MMRGTLRMRLLFAVLSPIFLLLCVVAIRSEEARPWVQYQEQFAGMLVESARARLQDAEASSNTQERARWERAVEQGSSWSAEIRQIYLEDAKIADRCPTCHVGIDNPLFEDAPQPHTAHPGTLLQSHDPSRFGCTVCHDGQGLATATDAAHGHEENWPHPMLPADHVQSTCARCHQTTHGLAEAEQVTEGADLFMVKGCYGCHDIPGVSYLPRFAPPLSELKSKLSEPEKWVYDWIKEPTRRRADTLMPNFHLDEQEAGKIAAFVLSLDVSQPRGDVDLGGASAEEGKRLFDERGCHGCHGVDSAEASASLRIPHLAGIGSKVTAEWLDRWISDPKAYAPEAAMPKVELTDDERHAVVAYLLTLATDEELAEPPRTTTEDIASGKDLVKQYECFGCHAIEGFEKTRPAVPDLSEFAGKPVDELDFGTVDDLPRTKWDWLRRKLEEPRVFEHDDIELKMPALALTDDERTALITFVLSLESRTLPAQYVVPPSPAGRALRDWHWMIARWNCNACHPLQGEEPHIARFFERQSRVPPTLDGVGARLQGQYLYQFLLEPKQVRPWFALRMPAFGFSEEEARLLVEGFAAAAEVDNPYTYVAGSRIDQERLNRGFQRFRVYKCIQCHPSSIEEGLPEDLDPDDLSINLMLSRERLRPEWLSDFMARPKQIAGTQTRMPTVFYTVEGRPKVDEPQRDIEDIVTYLMGMKEPPEERLAAHAEEREAEEKKEAVDWSTLQY